MLLERQWQPRSVERMPESVWRATLDRVRGEFDEMPCMRVTISQAGTLLGLPPDVTGSILTRLAMEGFLVQTTQGEYVKAGSQP